jgi:WD40 repeat protein
MKTAACPDAETVQRWLLGLVPRPQSELLAEHLAHCPRCGAVAGRLPARDTLVEALQQHKTLSPDTGLLSDLMDRLERLPLEAVESAAGPPSGPDAAAEAPADVPEIDRLGPYRVLGVLGRGGMGTVYLAEDPQLRRRLALKVLTREQTARPGARERFLREARAAAAVRHEYVVPIWQVGEDNDVPYIAMPLLHGETLAARLQREPRPPLAFTLGVARDVLAGLAAAHAAGLIHRDLKPANVWLEAPHDWVLLLDFGLAWAGPEDVRLTGTGLVVGTPQYMAPEQARGEEVGPAADLFSLGCLLYEMCTGTLPYTGGNALAIVWALATHEPRPPHELNPSVPRPLSDLVMRLLAKDQKDRPAGATAVIDALDQIGKPAPRPARRRRWRWAVALSSVAAGLLAAVVVVALLTRGGEVPPVTTAPSLPRRPASLALEAMTAEEIAAAERDELPEGVVAWLGDRYPRHWGAVYAVAVSPDGKWVASGGWDCVVRVWDAATLGTRAFLRGHTGPVHAVAFSPDGSLLVSGGTDGLRLWDLSGPRLTDPQVFALPASDGINAVAFAPDGQHFATAHHGGSVRLWTVIDGKIQRHSVLAAHADADVRAVAFSRDGETMASGSEDRTVLLWDLSGDQPRVKHTLRHDRGVVAVAFAPDGHMLATADRDRHAGTLRLWQLRGEPAEVPVQLRTAFVNALAFAPDGKSLAYGGARQGAVFGVLDLRGGPPHEASYVEGHWGGVMTAMAFSPDGRTLYSGHGDDGGVVLAWNMAAEAPAERHPLNGSRRRVIRMAFSPDEKKVAAAGSDREQGTGVFLWNWAATPAAQVAFLPNPGHEATGPAWGPGGRFIAFGESFSQYKVRLWALEQDAPRQAANLGSATEPAGASVALSHDGKWLASGGLYGQVWLWKVGSQGQQPVAPLTGHTGWVRALAFSPDDKVLASGADDGTVRLWHFSGEKPRLRAVLQGHKGSLRALAFTPDGKTLASGSSDRKIRLWDLMVEKPPEPVILGEHDDQVMALSFAPDGKTPASAGHEGDRRVLLWDVGRRQLRRRIVFPGSPLSVAFSPDGRHLATGGLNGVAYVLRVPEK